MNDSVQMPLIHHTAVMHKVLATATLLVRQGSNFFTSAPGGRSLEMEEYGLSWAKDYLTRSDPYINMLMILPHACNVMDSFGGSTG